jgi:hypothetical protein
MLQDAFGKRAQGVAQSHWVLPLVHGHVDQASTLLVSLVNVLVYGGRNAQKLMRARAKPEKPRKARCRKKRRFARAQCSTASLQTAR